jgi:hypothetical protein
MENRFKNFGGWFGPGAGCPTGSAEAGQIGLLRRAQKAAATTGCPIDFQQAAQFPVLPEGRADQGEEPGEAVAPEQLLGHFRIAPAAGVRARVLGRRRGPAQCRQRPGVQTQGVADVIESETVGKLGVEQAYDVTPRTEGAGLIFHAGLACQSRHQMRRNEVADLAQERELAGGWLVSNLIIHALPCGKARTGKPTFFAPQPLTL